MEIYEQFLVHKLDRSEPLARAAAGRHAWIHTFFSSGWDALDMMDIQCTPGGGLGYGRWHRHRLRLQSKRAARIARMRRWERARGGHPLGHAWRVRASDSDLLAVASAIYQPLPAYARRNPHALVYQTTKPLSVLPHDSHTTPTTFNSNSKHHRQTSVSVRCCRVQVLSLGRSIVSYEHVKVSKNTLALV